MDKFTQDRKLNKEQLEAVTHGRGPLMIIAGAGTGKTTVITERIKWLINQKLAQSSEILALTFTQKAAREMEERVDIAMPYGYTQMHIMTFHAFGERILRQEAIQIGLDGGYKLMTQTEAIIFFRKNLFSFELNYFRPMGNPTKFIEGMLGHFARLKDEDVSPSEYIRWASAFAESDSASADKQNKEERLEKEKYLELANAYRKYEELKIKEGVMDYGDLISNTLKLFKTRKNVLADYQKQFKFILIDEFQDTNFAQNELAMILSGKKQNITVVGDDDQAIYRFRGAAISNIIHFRKKYKKAKLVILTKNYRSTGEILDSAYTLIQFNNPDRLEVKEKINKKLTSQRRIPGEKIEFIYTARVEDEAEEVVKKIKSQKSEVKSEEGDEKYSWRDFAILVRANREADPFMRALSREGIPYQFLGPGMLFKQPEVKDLIAYLKLLDDFSDSVAFFRVLSMEIFDISARDLSAVNSFARRVRLSIFEAVEVINSQHIKDANQWSYLQNYASFLPILSEETKKTILIIEKMVKKHLELKKSETAGQILYYFLEDSGMLGKLTEYKTVFEERRVLNISKFFNKLKTYEAEHEDSSIGAVVDWIEMSMEMGESPLVADTDWGQNDAVNILTVHSSKGLEFPVVFLINLVAGRFPTYNRTEQIPIPQVLIKELLPEGDYHLEEERRLFYVGLTRAKDKLYLTASEFYGEGKRERKISPFVAETVGDKQAGSVIKPSSSDTIKQLDLLEWEKKEELPQRMIKTPLLYLSYSQIEAFMTCPLQYKYRYILQIPVPTNAAGSFGTSMHLALQRFYEMVKQKEKPTKITLLKLLDQVWLPIGYASKGHEEKMKARGREMLSGYFDNDYKINNIPLHLEQVFKIRLTPTLKIGGKIDRVDETRDGKLEIIDYKTGKRPSEKEIKENLQMTVYALAATDAGIYNRKAQDVILSFYFFTTQEKVSTTRSGDQIKKAKEKLLETAGQIDKSSFSAKTGRWCEFCDFRLVCDAYR